MNPDIHHLFRLQQLDSEIESARRRIAEIPAVQDALATRLEQATAAVAAVKERLAASQAERKKIEAEVATIQTRLSKYKGQLTELKTNKEYQAMRDASICGLGQAAPNPVLSVLKYFPKEVD